LALNIEEYLAHQPRIAKFLLFLAGIFSGVQTEFMTPLADGFVGDSGASFG
jgi:hypothetical protein